MENKIYGFIIISTSNVLIATIDTNNVYKKLLDFYSYMPLSHGRGSFTNDIVRKCIIRRKELVNKIIKNINETFIENDELNVDGLFIGISYIVFAHVKKILEETDLLNPKIKLNILKIVDVDCGGGISGLNQTIEKSSDILPNINKIE